MMMLMERCGCGSMRCVALKRKRMRNAVDDSNIWQRESQRQKARRLLEGCFFCSFRKKQQQSEDERCCDLGVLKILYRSFVNFWVLFLCYVWEIFVVPVRGKIPRKTVGGKGVFSHFFKLLKELLCFVLMEILFGIEGDRGLMCKKEADFLNN